MALARRGEVWLVDLGLAGKVRPVLVVTVEFSDIERALYGIVPHTTSTRGGRFEVAPEHLMFRAQGRYRRPRCFVSLESSQRVNLTMSSMR